MRNVASVVCPKCATVLSLGVELGSMTLTRSGTRVQWRESLCDHTCGEEPKAEPDFWENR